MNRPLFLRWLLINILTLGVLFLAYYFGNAEILSLNIVGKIMVGVIFTIFACISAYAATLAWQADSHLDPSTPNDHNRMTLLRHKAEHIAFAAEICPYVGLLGAVTGIFMFFSGNMHGVDPAHLKEIISESMAGVGVAFVPTITGVFFKIVLSWEHHLVVYSLKGAKLIDKIGA